MPRSQIRFRQADVTRAIRGAIDAGIEPHVEIDRDGRIVIERAALPLSSDLAADEDEWADAK